MDLKSVKIAAVSSYLPGKPVPIADIQEYLGYLQQAPQKIQKWIHSTHEVMKSILGIDHYYYAFDKETRKYTDDIISMAVKSAQKALADANMKASEVELIIYGGAFSHQIPPISTAIQEALGIESCGEMHIHSNCTSVYKAMQVAFDMLRLGRYKNALVVSSNLPSSLLRKEFYNQEKVKKEDLFLRWYLCDGAGAMILTSENSKSNGFFFESSYIESVGGKKKAGMGFNYPGYWENPQTIFENGTHHFFQLYQNELTRNFMDGNESLFVQGMKRMITKDSIDIKDLKYFLINMPTKYVVTQIMKESEKLGVKQEHVYSAISDMGYCGPPAIFVSLDKLLKNEHFENGDLILSFVTEVSKFLQAGFTIRYIS